MDYLKNQAKSSFKILSGKEESFAENENGLKVTTGEFEMRFIGEMEGTGLVRELKTYLDENYAITYALQYFKGKIANLEGSFVFEHKGYFKDGVVDSVWKIQKGTGSGELENIQGEVEFISGSKTEFEITLNYWFE